MPKEGEWLFYKFWEKGPHTHVGIPPCGLPPMCPPPPCGLPAPHVPPPMWAPPPHVGSPICGYLLQCSIHVAEIVLEPLKMYKDNMKVEEVP